jgi:hypothetical protein
MQKRPWFRVSEGRRARSGRCSEAVERAAATRTTRPRPDPGRYGPDAHGAGDPAAYQSVHVTEPGVCDADRRTAAARLRGAGRSRRGRGCWTPTRRSIPTRRAGASIPTQIAAGARRLRDPQRRQAGEGRHLRAHLPGADRVVPEGLLVGPLVLQRQRQLRVLQPVLRRLVLLLGPPLPARLRVERLLPVGPVLVGHGATTAAATTGAAPATTAGTRTAWRPAGTTAATATTIITEAAVAERAGRPSTHGAPSLGGPSGTRHSQNASLGGPTGAGGSSGVGPFDSKAPGPQGGSGMSPGTGRPNGFSSRRRRLADGG